MPLDFDLINSVTDYSLDKMQTTTASDYLDLFFLENF
jgi:hypothetical protein